MARTPMTVTLSVPSVDREDLRTNQVVDIVFRFEKVLKARRGLRTALSWRRDLNKFLTTPGTTYEQIRARLEQDLNLELTLTHNELAQIVSP